MKEKTNKKKMVAKKSDAVKVMAKKVTENLRKNHFEECLNPVEHIDNILIGHNVTPTMSDPVNHPKHYNHLPIDVECIDVIEHFPCNTANAIKYIWRAGQKGNMIQDLEKAAWYVNRQIQLLKGETPHLVILG